ncbi:MAG TPA: lysophospholipid acyltransferase family protein [Gaiellaceae bacterium]|jgi:1-acyl-sn-glycerol-3-phosphate acyltransferase|nr:lysophospholipid acyltransferase family protein [Gaiellaceae bacterium]
MRRVDAVWAVGRVTLGTAVRILAPLRNYGVERVPREGGVVLALNHFSWVDPAVFGTLSPRTIHYLGKIEAHRALGLGQLIRSFGTLSVRRGESDREAVRLMRQVVRDERALGMFVEGTRQRSGVPGEAKPGGAMVALQEEVPVVPAAIHGTQHWRVGNFHPVSVAWGEPMRFDGLPRSGKGYREATALIQDEILRLWQFLVEMHEAGRPEATPPRLGRQPASGAGLGPAGAQE